MSRWQQDAVDFACEAWAWQWVNMFARLPLKASEQIGRVGSTLDIIKLMGDGAGGAGHFVQIHPECFLGAGLIVACTLKTLTDRQREVVWHHYVDRWYWARVVPVETHDGRNVYEHTTFERRVDSKSGVETTIRVVDRSRPLTRVAIEKRVRPVKQEIVARQMGVSASRYYQLRDSSKARIAKVVDPLETKVDDGRAAGVALSV